MQPWLPAERLKPFLGKMGLILQENGLRGLPFTLGGHCRALRLKALRLLVLIGAGNLPLCVAGGLSQPSESGRPQTISHTRKNALRCEGVQFAEFLKDVAS